MSGQSICKGRHLPTHHGNSNHTSGLRYKNEKKPSLAYSCVTLQSYDNGKLLETYKPNLAHVNNFKLLRCAISIMLIYSLFTWVIVIEHSDCWRFGFRNKICPYHFYCSTSLMVYVRQNLRLNNFHWKKFSFEHFNINFNIHVFCQWVTWTIIDGNEYHLKQKKDC